MLTIFSSTTTRTNVLTSVPQAQSLVQPLAFASNVSLLARLALTGSLTSARPVSMVISTLGIAYVCALAPLNT